MSNQNADQKTQEKSSSLRKRGASFPQVALPSAIEIIKTAGAYGREHSIQAIAGYLGHQTPNSGPFKQKLAAFREWGLLSGSGDRLTITDLGWAIAHPENEQAERHAFQEAFKNSSLFCSLYDNCARNQPIKVEGLANQAVTQHGVSASAKKKFIESFKESAVAAGLAVLEGNDAIKFLPAVDPANDDLANDVEEEPLIDSPVPPDQGGVPVKDVKKQRKGHTPLLTQKWVSDDGAIVFEVHGTSALSSKSFEQLGKVVSELEKLASQLGFDKDEDDVGADISE